MKTTIELGKNYKDSITGFQGIATAYTIHLYGCLRICLESKTKKNEDGESIELWFDEQRLTIKSKAGNGGPQKIPTKFKQEKRQF